MYGSSTREVKRTQLAIRVARAFTGRNTLLRFEGHFHGWHDEVVHGFQPPFDADGSLGVAPRVRDNVVSIRDGDLNLLEDVLSRINDIAAVILEPSGASWGRVPVTQEFLHGLREITQRHNVQLIFDEVVTGFRFSPGGAQQLYNVIPDLSCFAKIVAGGMPGGALVGRADVMSLFEFTGDAKHDRHQRVNHQGTFNALPLSAAAGVALLRLVATGQPIQQANALTEQLRVAWDQVLDHHNVAGYVYGTCSTFHGLFRNRSTSPAGCLHSARPAHDRSRQIERHASEVDRQLHTAPASARCRHHEFHRWCLVSRPHRERHSASKRCV